MVLFAGCATPPPRERSPASQPTSGPARTVYDTTLARPIEPRDGLERIALERGADFRLIDRLTEESTRIPPFQRRPLPPLPPDARIAESVPLLDERDPFPPPEALAARAPTIRVGIGRSTFRTHEPEEVLSAIQPFLDLTQREVNVRADAELFEKADQAYYALLDGREQLVICHAFDYLLIRSWFADQEGNGAVLLGVALPAHPLVTDADRALPGIESTNVELVIRADAQYESPAALKGARLALAAKDTHGPGVFLTQVLREAGQPLDQPFFASVTLRRYAKDAVLDVLLGKADVACVSRATTAALERFYGLGRRIRRLAVSPRYNLDVLVTSLNNVATHRTEIELTQRQLATLRKNPEGQEVLFFFDEYGWQYPQGGELTPAEQVFEDFLTFYEQTPRDLRPLLDPAAAVDRRTYDRFGDE